MRSEKWRFISGILAFAVVGLILAISNVQPAHADPILVPVFGEPLPDYTAIHPAGYPFDPSGMETSSFLIGTQLHGSGWEGDARLFGSPTGLVIRPGRTNQYWTGCVDGGLSGGTTSSGFLNVANPFLTNDRSTCPVADGFRVRAHAAATGDDWPGGSDASDSFLMDIIVESSSSTRSWQEANVHIHARYLIEDSGWTYGHTVTLSADFTPDVDWGGSYGGVDVRMVFGWALGDVVDFYHDWGPRSDPDQINDLLTAHYDAIAAGDGDAFYYSHIFPYSSTPTAESDTLTLVVDSGETFDIDAFLRGHMTNRYGNPKSNGTIELTVSVERIEPPFTIVIDHAKIDFKKKADDDKVRVKGKLLYLDLDDVDISEPVTVTVGPLSSQTIQMEEKGKKGDKWEYKRPKGESGIKHMKIHWKDGEAKFDIRVDKADLGDMSAWTNPVTISIQIGGDVGSESITMSEKKHHWDYKAEKPKKPKAVGIEPLAITDAIKVVAYPNPIRDVDTATFQVMGTLATQVEEIRVQIYDLSGRLVWEDAALGSELDWHTDCLSGDYLANGIYLYSVQLRIGGNWINQDIGKIAVLR